jgi:hypothetical protein
MDQFGLQERQKLLKEYQVVQQKWNQKIKNQTSNLKELTGIHLALEHTKNKMTLSVYRKLIRQGMSDIGID